MRGKLDEMDVFVRVTKLGSFSAAARALKLTPSAVSKVISRLEARLDAQLVDRSTRILRLTPEGEVYLGSCERVLAEIEAAEDRIGRKQAAPSGPLAVNSSIPIARHHVIPLLPEFLQRYPGIQLELSLSDSLVSLLEQRIDVAIRIGPLQDSNLRARRLAGFRRMVVAAPAYLGLYGTPHTPADLGDHNCLGFTIKASLNAWPFRLGEGIEPVPVAGNFRTDNGETLREMCLAGLGIARLGSFMIEDDVATGRLVPLLQPFWPDEEIGVFAVFGSQRFMPARLRCFVDFLVERLARRVRPVETPAAR